MKTLAMVLAVLAGAALAYAQAGPTAGATAVPGAATAWVAFDANFVRTEPGERRVVGWFHRAADGSTREESNADGPSHPVVLIMNVARRLQYRFENGAWDSYPVNLPPNGFLPEAAEHDPRRYTPARAIENIPVFRFVNPQGAVQLVAPSLNDFPLRTERPDGGRETFSNVLVEDQPAGLFEPPPDAKVSAHSFGAGGVTYTPAGSPLPKAPPP